MGRTDQAGKLAKLLTKHLDPSTTFWTAVENQPRSLLSGLLQRRRRRRAERASRHDDCLSSAVGFIEMKSTAGIASRAQRQVRAELVAAGAQWWMARSAVAALVALHRSGVEFRRPWKPPANLRPWEGPFTGEEKRLPRHPLVRERQREANRRWRENRRARGIEVWRPSRITDERRAQVREATKRWRERQRAGALEAATRDDGPALATGAGARAASDAASG